MVLTIYGGGVTLLLASRKVDQTRLTRILDLGSWHDLGFATLVPRRSSSIDQECTLSQSSQHYACEAQVSS
jgi:hypothetical protein